MRQNAFLVFAIVLGTIAIAVVVPGLAEAVDVFLRSPSAILWIALAVAAATLPLRGTAGVGSLNISPLPLLTTLALYGSSAAILGGALVGFAATLASRTGKWGVDVQRGLLNSAKHVLCLVAAGWILWGASSTAGAVDLGIARAVLLWVLLAHAAYFTVSNSILSFGLWLRDGRSPLEPWRAIFGWGALLSWSTPVGAYLLSLFYLSGGVLVIAILIGMGLVQILALRDFLRVKLSFTHLIDALGLARDGNMPHLKGETHRVVEIAVALGHKMRLPYKSMQLLERGAMLHNVGYIAVDRDTVDKPTLLTDREMGEIREHPESGMRILNEVIGMGSVADIVRSHHESPDGTGYPQGLKGSQVPMESAIIKVAEAYVAMTSPRPHRKKVYSKDQALEEVLRVAGHSLDAAVAYYLFDLMGRHDLAVAVSRGFGPPSSHQTKRRLYKPRLQTSRLLPRRKREQKSMLLGVSIVATAACVLCFSMRYGFSLASGTPAPWLSADSLGGMFFLFMLGLAALRPVRLPWGAYVSSASAVVLVVSLAGGPGYAVVFGFALIGWAMLLDPANALSSTLKTMEGITANSNGHRYNGDTGRPRRPQSREDETAGDTGKPRGKSNGGITSLIKAKALASKLSTAVAYGGVLIVSGSGAWLAYRLGDQISSGLRLSGTAYSLFPFFLAVPAYYLAETVLQSALLSGNGLSAFRLWQRNYLKIFPEPLTYAVCGFAILLGTDLLGLWAAVPLFLFPTLWRHLALLRRLELLKTKESLIRAVARAVDEKDRYTGGHSASVVEIGVAVAREMGKAEPFVEKVEEAAIRHDLGKVSWPNQVLRKPARLQGEEQDYKWTHPDVSAEIAAHAGSSWEVVTMIKYHHERYDGRGYPEGLKRDAIPLGARILCVADSFDAMVHDRWYKRKRTIEGAVEEIKRCAGTQFDPAVVAAFLRILDKMDLERLVEAVEDVVGEIEDSYVPDSDEEYALADRSRG